MKPRAVSSSLLLLLSLLGCDGSGTGPGQDRVSSVTISPPAPIVEVGNTVQLSAVVQKANGTLLATPVTWSTSAASVATCSGTGLVAGVSEGTATVTATAGGVSGTVSISVIDLTTPTPPSGISAVPLSDTRIRVTWTDNSANEDEFRIDREPVAGGVSGTDGRPARVFAEAGIVGPGVTTFEDTGLDSGTSYRYRVRACNENGCSDPSGHQTEIATFETLVIQTTTLPAGRTGQAYQQALTASGGNGIVAWSVSGGSLPNGLTLSGAGVLGGTPATAGVFQFSIQVVGAGQTVSREFSLTIQGVLTVTTTSLPDGVAGTAYNSLLQASGGDGTHTWSVIVGALPGGLTLAPSGTLSGTPTATGDFPITVSVTSGGQVIVANFAIRIFDPLAITTGPLPDGMVGSAYSQILTATGGDGSYTWSVSSGALPDGLTLGAASGAISGTSGTVGTFEFTVRISSSGLTASRAYSITIRPLLAVTTAFPSQRASRGNLLPIPPGGRGRWVLHLVPRRRSPSRRPQSSPLLGLDHRHADEARRLSLHRAGGQWRSHSLRESIDRDLFGAESHHDLPAWSHFRTGLFREPPGHGWRRQLQLDGLGRHSPPGTLPEHGWNHLRCPHVGRDGQLHRAGPKRGRTDLLQTPLDPNPIWLGGDDNEFAQWAGGCFL